jgi:transposase
VRLGASLLPQSVTPAFPDASVADAGVLGDLLPHLAGLLVDRVISAAGGVVIEARCGSAGAACPACGAWSSQVHSGYARTVADGPAGGLPVLIRLRVRRFFCGNASCAAVTFAEQADGLTGRYLRRSLPLRGLLAQIGLVLAGRAGARLAAILAVPVHRTTLLRLVAELPEPVISAAPEVTGIDDFAFKRGRVYGTVLVDVATGKAVDLLPDREAATVAAWLAAHPGAKVICRDRAGGYADAARQGAPEAIQVADRWHLWHNLGEYVEKAVAAHRGCLTPSSDARKDDRPGTAGPPAGAEGLRDVCGRERRLVARTGDRHAAVHSLLAAGHSERAAAQILSLSRGTVHRYAAAATVGELLGKATSRHSKLDRYKPYLRKRWNEGITSAAALHAELQAKGWQGSVQAVQRYVRPFRAMTAAPPPGPVVPATRQITRWLLTRPAVLNDDEQALLAAVLRTCPHLNALAGHVRSFAEMMGRRQGQQELEGWLTQIEAGDLPELRSFANGIRRDQQAVTAGLTLPYSSAAVEGTVTKIKMLKRQTYGRASFNLLRKRVILHPG